MEAVESVKGQGKVCILDIDVQGVQNVKKSSLKPLYLFVAPPSMDVLEARLRGRGTEKEEDIVKRLGNAAKEIEYGNGKGNFDRLFVNDNLEETCDAMVEQFKQWYPDLVETELGRETKAELDSDDLSLDGEIEAGFPRPVVFAGPSGVGKGTLIEMLMKRFPNNQFGFSVSHTTRKPRDGEIDGVHYNFSTVEKMKGEIDEGKFIEYAEVHGNYYGTRYASFVLDIYIFYLMCVVGHHLPCGLQEENTK